jgi:ABC-type transport system involved in cytochrome c biogenesis ATPase subunit
VITFRDVASKRGPLAAGTIEGDWGPGAHAILSAAPEFGRTLLALASGALRPRRGTVQVLGGSPSDARVRKQVAHVGAEVALPDRLRVDEVLSAAASLRGDPPSDGPSRLSAWGLESLARRAVASLSRAETKAVAVAEAFTSSRVRVVLLEEPFVTLDAEASERLASAIRAKATEGGIVLFSTGSVRDACAFGADVAVLGSTGALQRLAPGAPPFAISTPAPSGSPSRIRLALVAANPRDAEALAGQLVRDPNVAGLAYSAALPAQTVVLHVEGNDLVALADAAARASVASRVDVLQLHVETRDAAESR